MIQLPTVGQFYDLVALITTKLEHPFEDAQKSFAQEVDLDTELTISEIQSVLFKSKQLSTFDAQKSLIVEQNQIEEGIEEISTTTTSEYSESAQAQQLYAETFNMFKSALDALMIQKDEADQKQCIQYVNKFFEYIHPYISSFTQPGYTVLLYAILSYIENSKTSSIARRDMSSEVFEHKNSFDILTNVSLIEHILDVVELTVQQMNQTPGLTSQYEGMLIVGMYHDIGKIEKHISQYLSENQAYAMIDHALISAEFLRRRYDSLNEEAPIEYLDAIRFHHKPESDCPKSNNYFKKLKFADHKAREKEILRNIDKLPTMSQLMTKEQLIDIIFQMFNVDYSNRMSIPDIFCLKGYLFVQETKLKENISKYLSRNNKLCKEQKLSDTSYLVAVKNLLIEHELVSAEKINQFPVLVYKSNSIRTRNEKKLMNFITISLEVFNVITHSFPSPPQEFNTVVAIEFKKYYEARV